MHSAKGGLIYWDGSLSSCLQCCPFLKCCRHAIIDRFAAICDLTQRLRFTYNLNLIVVSDTFSEVMRRRS